MFNIFKNWFNTGQDPLGITGESKMTATIEPSVLGFALVNTRTGDAIATYSRRRDAVRGAKRRGLEVA